MLCSLLLLLALYVDSLQVSGVHGPSCIYASSRDSNVYGWSVNVDRPQSAGAGPDCVFRGHSLSVTSLTGSPGELHVCVVQYVHTYIDICTVWCECTHA